MRSRRCIHSGDSPIVTLATRTTRRGHRSGASTTADAPSSVSATATGGRSLSVNGRLKCAARSRAMPTIPIASGRFGVIFRSKITSSMPSTSRTSVPSSTSPSMARIPAWSSPRPSSRAEHSIPIDVSPRILRFAISIPPGRWPPTVASGTTMPARMLGAPHTTRTTPSPVSTSASWSLSAFGCGSTSTIRAATTPPISAPGETISSTSSPRLSSAVPITSASASIGVKSRIQESGARIVAFGSASRQN